MEQRVVPPELNRLVFETNLSPPPIALMVCTTTNFSYDKQIVCNTVNHTFTFTSPTFDYNLRCRDLCEVILFLSEVK